VDVVGCGDAYEAAFVLDYIKNGDIEAAGKTANLVAAMNCTFVGSSRIAEIKQIINKYMEDT
jgi:sugar/nucleoside kinase (ribokinase family)